MGSEPAMPGELSAGTRNAVFVALSIQTLISAGTFLAAKRAMGEMDPFTLVICRFLLAGAAFLGILGVMPGSSLPPRRIWLKVAGLGFLAGPINQGALFYGLSRSRAAHGALFYALTPMLVLVISVARGRERTSWRTAGGILTALIGVLILLLSKSTADVSGPLFGDLFILAAVMAWAFFTIDGKPLIAEFGAIRATAWTMSAAMVLILPLALVRFDTHALKLASTTAFSCIAYLALLTSVVSYLLWYYALSKTEASKVAVFSNLQPVATAVMAWLILGDPLTWELLVGGGLVIAGVRVTQTRAPAVVADTELGPK